MKKDISCDIVRDLLISYMDETCSEESRKIVKDHIEECSSCRNELENYTKNIKYSTDKEKNLVSSKPFKKIKHRIRALVITLCIIIVLIIPVIVYGSYSYRYGGFKADEKFLSVSASDFLKEDTINNYITKEARTMYNQMYYSLKEKRGESVYEADVSELLDEYNMIQNLKLDYDNIYEAVIDYDNNVYINIPLITPWDSYKTTIVLHAVWKAPGQYKLQLLQLEYEKAFDYGYGLPASWIVGDFVEPWAFCDFYCAQTYPDTINLLRNSRSNYVFNTPEADKETDTGLKFKSGVYRWTDEVSSDKTDIIFFDDRTVFYKRYFKSNDFFDSRKLYNTIRPSKYYTSSTSQGQTNLNIFYSKKMHHIGLITQISDTEIEINNKVFKLISTDLPDQKELENIINEDSFIKYSINK